MGDGWHFPRFAKPQSAGGPVHVIPLQTARLQSSDDGLAAHEPCSCNLFPWKQNLRLHPASIPASRGWIMQLMGVTLWTACTWRRDLEGRSVLPECIAKCFSEFILYGRECSLQRSNRMELTRDGREMRFGALCYMQLLAGLNRNGFCFFFYPSLELVSCAFFPWRSQRGHSFFISIVPGQAII